MSKHIYIQQGIDNIENVNTYILSKIYNIADKDDKLSNVIDSSSDFRGRLNVGYTYQHFIQKITGKFKNLFINVIGYYIDFKDKLVESLLATAIGDGSGVTESNISTVTNNDTIAAIDFTGVTSFHEFGLFTNLTTIGNLTHDSNSQMWGKLIDFKSIDKITVPYTTLGNSSGITFSTVDSIKEFIAPYTTIFNHAFGTKLEGILYIGTTTFRSYQPPFRLSSGDHIYMNKMLYIPNVTSLSTNSFGGTMWRATNPWAIVYMKGVYGEQIDLQYDSDNSSNYPFYNSSIQHLVINNIVLPTNIKEGILNAQNVWVPLEILTSNTVNNITTYSLTIEDPWAAAGKTPIFHNIEDFQTVETLEDWENEGMPIKLVKELM